MSFLDAHRIIRRFAGGPPLDFLLAMSGTSDALDVFVRAAAANHGRESHMAVLPFNTLTQALLTERDATTPGVLLLFPWDLVAEADWRSGIPAQSLDEDVLRARASEIIDRIVRWHAAGVLYVPAPIPPLFADPTSDEKLAQWLRSLIVDSNARVLPETVFSLSSYLTTGSPFASAALDEVAESVVSTAMQSTRETRKVLVTDLDNVMWGGVIGEDGVDGIVCAAEGAGYRHFLYQTFLRKLKREGTLLAAVTRNDQELAHAPFVAGRTTLTVDDFVAIVASYNAKSSQIRALAEQLNLGLNAFVFVDDNPLELAEVAKALPGVSPLRFPGNVDAFPEFLNELAWFFPKETVTSEDAQRTELYKRRLSSMVPTDAAGSDLTEFLRGLGMQLTISDRSVGDRTRAVQLINKTNQFNLNGLRFTDTEVGEIVAAGGRLYTGELADRSGSHGEILAMLIDSDRVVRSFVMSCRVFQRRVEFAFLAWLAGGDSAPQGFGFAETLRNEPIRQFLRDDAFVAAGHEGLSIHFEPQTFKRAHHSDMGLFEIRLQS